MNGSSDALRTMLAQGGARLAAGLLQKLGVERAVVLGHSAGGLTALELHRRFAADMQQAHACAGHRGRLHAPKCWHACPACSMHMHAQCTRCRLKHPVAGVPAPPPPSN